MNESVKLYCTKDEETGEWLVWFPRALGGMNVLESFENESDARAFWQDQIDAVDLGDNWEG